MSAEERARAAAAAYLEEHWPSREWVDPIQIEALERADACGMAPVEPTKGTRRGVIREGPVQGFTAGNKDAVAQLAIDAETDPAAWRAVLMIMDSLAKRGEPAPAPLVALSVRVHRGEIEAPVAQRRQPPGVRFRIVGAIKAAVEAGGEGFFATRSKDNSNPCGVSVVCDWLNANGHPIDYGTVEGYGYWKGYRAWVNRR